MHLIIGSLFLILHIRLIYSICIMIQKDDISINTVCVYVILLIDTEEYILYMNVLLKVLLKRKYIKMILILFGLRNYMLIKELSSKGEVIELMKRKNVCIRVGKTKKGQCIVEHFNKTLA